MAEHTQAFVDLKADLRQFEARVDRRFEAIDARFDSLDRKIDSRFSTLSTEIGGVRREAATHFRWIVGMFLATIASVVGALVGQ